jgi:DNA-binding NarL/FixJ family response regulator
MLTQDPVLVIDEIPLIAAGLEEILQSVQPGTAVIYACNVFTVLSSRSYAGKTFGLIVLGSAGSRSPSDTLRNISALKAQFPRARIMLCTDQYEPGLIDKLEERMLDGYIHKHEDVGEIRNGLTRILSGEAYLSPMLDTLYHTWRFNR